jgi:hypothetical protein
MFSEATGHEILRQEKEGEVFLYVLRKTAPEDDALG